MLISRTAGVVGLLLLGLNARAGVVNLVSQTRFVDFNFPAGNQQIAAPDFGPFTASLGDPRANAVASQNSTLTLTPAGAEFFAQGVIHNTPAPFSNSFFQVDFEVTLPLHYTLLTSSGAVAGDNAIATFSGPFGMRSILSVNETGTLLPGTYSLVESAPAARLTDYSLSFTAVPTPLGLWTALTLLPGLLLWKRRRPVAFSSGPRQSFNMPL